MFNLSPSKGILNTTAAHAGRKHAFTPETQTRAGPVVRSVRPCDAGLLARQEGRLRVRARRRIPQPIPGRGVLRPAREMVEGRAGGDERSPRPGPRRGLRTGPPRALPPAETASCGGDRRLANPGGARPNPRGPRSLPGERAAAATRARDVRHHYPHGEQPRPRRGRSADATIPARRAANFHGPRASHRQHPDPRYVDSTAPAVREMEHRTGPPTRTPHVARTVQGSRRRLVRPPVTFAGGPRRTRARHGLGSRAGPLRAARRSRQLRRRAATSLSPDEKTASHRGSREKVHPVRRPSERPACPSSTSFGSRPSRKRGRTKGRGGRTPISRRCPPSSTSRTGSGSTRTPPSRV